MDKIRRIYQEIERLKKQEKENEKAELMSDSWILGRQVMLEHFEHFLNTLSEEPDKSLEKAAGEYAEGIIEKEDAFMCKAAFEAGAEWQKDQMLKDAEECELYWDGDFLAIDLNMVALGYSEKDKVKVIVLKDESK